MSATEPVRATRLHHMGIAVSNLERSLEFYADLFDLHAESSFEVERDFVARVTRVDGAEVRGAFLPLPNGGLELLEYRGPQLSAYALRNCDVGAAHPCFEVDDIDAAYARLTALGADCYTEPLPIEGGALDGYRWFYFADPDGLLVELFEPPELIRADFISHRDSRDDASDKESS